MPLELEIVTPDRLMLSRAVEMVVIPAMDGDIGVLEGHTPMIVPLRGGMVSLYQGGVVSDQWFILGGFAEITGERCTVLATEAIVPAELRQDQAESLLRQAEADYAALAGGDIDEQQLALDRIDAARSMVKAAAGAQAH